MLIIFTPWATTGFGRPAAPVTCAPWVPIMSGTFGPVMSASSRPTSRAVARQADGEVHGHGRLADAALAGRHGDRVAHAGDQVGGGSAEAALHVARPVDAHEARAEGVNASPMSFSIVALSGQAGVVSSTVRSTTLPSIVDVLDHPERDEVAPDLGVLHPAERGEDVLVCQLIGHGRAEGSSDAGPMRPIERSRARPPSDNLFEPTGARRRGLLGAPRPPGPAARWRQPVVLGGEDTRHGARRPSRGTGPTEPVCETWRLIAASFSWASSPSSSASVGSAVGSIALGRRRDPRAETR